MSEDNNSVEKAESSGASVTRPPQLQSEKGQPRIVTSNRFIQDQKRVDLRMPNRLCTYDQMVEDDAVFNSIDVTNLLVLIALNNGQFISPSGSKKSKIATDFLNYSIRNMGMGTWLEAMTSAVTDIQYGFALQNIVLKRRNYGPYKGSLCLHKLAPRDQKSVYGWVWNKDLTECKGFVQKPLYKKMKEGTQKEYESGLFLNNISNGLYKPNYPFLKTEQLLHFRFNPVNNNPQGDSPLNHCYDAWQEKKLVERYEIIGISKDLSGSVVVRVPSELIQKANNPEMYPAEAAEYRQLQEDAGALHAGESSYIVLTSDADEVTKRPLFDFELKGIEGGLNKAA